MLASAAGSEARLLVQRMIAAADPGVAAAFTPSFERPNRTVALPILRLPTLPLITRGITPEAAVAPARQRQMASLRPPGQRLVLPAAVHAALLEQPLPVGRPIRRAPAVQHERPAPAEDPRPP